MQKNTKFYPSRSEKTQNQTNLHLEPHDYLIYYVNIDLRHHYGISVVEAQTLDSSWQNVPRRNVTRAVFAGLCSWVSSKKVSGTEGAKQSVCVAHCYFIVHVNVLHLPFASPKAIYR